MSAFFDSSNSERKLQAHSAHQSKSGVIEHIFASATDDNDMTTIGGMTEFMEYIFKLNTEEDCKIFNEGMNKNRTDYSNMTVYVRTTNGKTISIKCDRQRKAARIL